jgi:hypothetical protein
MNRLLKRSIISSLFLCAGCKPNIIHGFYDGFYWKKSGNSWYYFTPSGQQWARVDSEADMWHLQGDCVAAGPIHLESRWDTRDNAFRAAEQMCHDHRCEAEQTCNNPSPLDGVRKPVVVDDDVEQPQAAPTVEK